MTDDELKDLLAKMPAPEASTKFKNQMMETLVPTKVSSAQMTKLGSSLALQPKKNYWQYVILASMLVAAVIVIHDHQKNDHSDVDELMHLNTVSEITLSTL